MQGGDADEFIDYMNDGEASVRHRGYVYRFSGLKYHPGRLQRKRGEIPVHQGTFRGIHGTGVQL